MPDYIKNDMTDDSDIAHQIRTAKASKTKWLQHGLTCYDDELDISFALAEALALVELRAQMLLVMRQRRKNTERGRKVLKEMYPNEDHEDPNAKF
jgi:hypothetical protein